jgi:hypothetical protein
MGKLAPGLRKARPPLRLVVEARVMNEAFNPGGTLLSQ